MSSTPDPSAATPGSPGTSTPGSPRDLQEPSDEVRRRPDTDLQEPSDEVRRHADHPDLPELSNDEIRRYARHLVLPDVGEEGQRRLKDARVLCVGAGGLGSPLALYLAAAGVGTLGLVDDDTVDLTNLQRQILHGTSDIGRAKLDSAADRIADVNPHVEVVRHETRLTSDNALEILEPWDVVVDGTDNFPTRYLVNDACVLLGKPNVYGSIFRWEGQVSLFGAPEGWSERFAEVGAEGGEAGDAVSPAGRDAAGDRGPCYRCLFREPPPPGLVPSCAEGGVMGVLPGIVGSMQAMETIKWILGRGEPLVSRLMIFDGLAMRWREVGLRRNRACPVCGDEPTQEGLIDYEIFCGLEEPSSTPQQPVPPADSGGRPVEGGPPRIPQMDVEEAAARLRSGSPPFLLDVREPWEWRVGNLEGLGAVLVPMGELPERLDEVPRDRTVVVCCRTGARSDRAAELLRESGVEDVHNLSGGMTAWKARVDPDVDVA